MRTTASPGPAFGSGQSLTTRTLAATGEPSLVITTAFIRGLYRERAQRRSLHRSATDFAEECSTTTPPGRGGVTMICTNDANCNAESNAGSRNAPEITCKKVAMRIGWQMDCRRWMIGLGVECTRGCRSQPSFAVLVGNHRSQPSFGAVAGNHRSQRHSVTPGR